MAWWTRTIERWISFLTLLLRGCRSSSPGSRLRPVAAEAKEAKGEGEKASRRPGEAAPLRRHRYRSDPWQRHTSPAIGHASKKG